MPKGRINLPREAKAMSEDKILVFAEGRQAEEAKKAGAHFVGGPELIDGVSLIAIITTILIAAPRLSTTAFQRQLSSALQLLYGQSHPSWAVSLVL